MAMAIRPPSGRRGRAFLAAHGLRSGSFGAETGLRPSSRRGAGQGGAEEQRWCVVVVEVVCGVLFLKIPWANREWLAFSIYLGSLYIKMLRFRGLEFG